MTAAFDINEEEKDLRGPAIIITGSVATGFVGHGTFHTVDDALKWFTQEKQLKYGPGVISLLANVMNMLFGDFILVGTTSIGEPYSFIGPFDTDVRAAEAAAIITQAIVQQNGSPMMFDIMKVSKEEEVNVESQHDNNV